MVFIILSPKIWFVPEKFQVDEPISLAFLILRELQVFQHALLKINVLDCDISSLRLVDILVFQTRRTLSVGLSHTRTACSIKLLRMNSWSCLALSLIIGTYCK
jgi:hypothetical protein